MSVMGWMTGVGGLLVLGVIIFVLVVFSRSALRARQAGESSPVVGVTLTVAAVWAVVSAVGAIVATTSNLMLEDVSITIPVETFWPQLPEGTVVGGTTATRVGGGFESANVVVTGLSAGARVMWAISQGLWWLIPTAIAAMLAIACFQLQRGRAFAPVVTRMAIITAVVVTVGGVAAQMLGDISGSMAASELLSFSGAEFEDVPGVESTLDAWLPKPGFTVTFPFWPLAAGLGFAALAAIFTYGHHLQKDSEGLV